MTDFNPTLTNTIQWILSGVNAHTPQANAKISTEPFQKLQAFADGLNCPPIAPFFQSLAPPHNDLRRYWINTSVFPYQLLFSTGTAWVSVSQNYAAVMPVCSLNPTGVIVPFTVINGLTTISTLAVNSSFVFPSTIIPITIAANSLSTISVVCGGPYTNATNYPCYTASGTRYGKYKVIAHPVKFATGGLQVGSGYRFTPNNTLAVATDVVDLVFSWHESLDLNAPVYTSTMPDIIVRVTFT